MAAANPAQRAPTHRLAPYYRRYELPWSPSEEMERRFRVILRNLTIVFAIIAVLMPFLPRHEQVVNTDSLPERVVQLVMEPPPPPAAPAAAQAGEAAREGAGRRPNRCRSRWIRASRRRRAGCSRAWTIWRRCAIRSISTNSRRTSRRPPIPATSAQVTRSLITSKAGGTSGGISAPTSSGLAAGSRVAERHPHHAGEGSDARPREPGARRARGGSGKASRSADEIALVFTRNKGAIDAMYARALRDNPALQGKVVIELTIAPSGDITAARIVSSELNDPEFESKLLARIRLFKFERRTSRP